MNKIIVNNPKNVINSKIGKNYFKLVGTGGPKGDKGDKGDTGAAATISAGTASSLPAGSSPTVTNSGTSSAAVFNFGIPKGDKGDKGDTGATGAAATITVGSTTTGAAGTNASVTNTGTSGAAVLNFTIPRGDKGETGATGATGATGQAATIAVGSTTTLAPGSSATVTNSGTSSAATFNFGIPQGVKGDTGSVKSAYVTSLPSTGNENTYYLNGDTATTGSVSGTAVQITNADNTGEISDFKLNGNTEQTTYTGKNLVGLAHSPASSQILEGVTVSSQTDEKLVIVSSNAQYTCLRLFYQLPAGTYTASTKGTSSDSYEPRITIYKAGIAIAQGVTPSSPKSFTLTEEATIDFRFFATTSEATVRTVTFYDFQLEKNNQATTYEPYCGGIPSPNPDYPQPINVVTGSQVVNINGVDYPVTLGSTELAKIGTYTDYIYKDNGTWKVHKDISKVVLNGTENWGVYSTTNYRYDFYINISGKGYTTSTTQGIACDTYTINSSSANDTTRQYQYTTRGTTYDDRVYFMTPKSAVTGSTSQEIVASFKTFISNHITTFYYALATATDTAITESALITQLDNLVSAELLSGVNNIILVPANQPDGTMSIDYTTWDKHDRYDVYIWNDTIGDYQLIHAGGGNN